MVALSGDRCLCSFDQETPKFPRSRILAVPAIFRVSREGRLAAPVGLTKLSPRVDLMSAPGLEGPWGWSRSTQHRCLHGARAEPVQGLLAGLRPHQRAYGGLVRRDLRLASRRVHEVYLRPLFPVPAFTARSFAEPSRARQRLPVWSKESRRLRVCQIRCEREPKRAVHLI
jgi:hypothetical protein